MVLPRLLADSSCQSPVISWTVQPSYSQAIGSSSFFFSYLRSFLWIPVSNLSTCLFARWLALLKLLLSLDAQWPRLGVPGRGRCKESVEQPEGIQWTSGGSRQGLTTRERTSQGQGQGPETEIRMAPQNQKLGSEIRGGRTSQGVVHRNGAVVCFFGPKCIQVAWFGGMALRYMPTARSDFTF